MADGGKALRQAAHIVHMAHPADGLLRHPLKEQALGIVVHRRLAKFAGRRAFHLAAQHLAHHLQTVAQSQDGQSLLEYRRIHLGRAFFIYAVRPAGKDDPDGAEFLYLLQRLFVGVHLAVNAQVTHPPGDQFIILPAEIQHQNCLVFHVPPRLFFAAVSAQYPSFSSISTTMVSPTPFMGPMWMVIPLQMRSGLWQS